MNRAVRAATIGALLFTPVVLSACSAGQLNQTSTQERDKSGGSATVGDLTLRSVQVAYPENGKYAAGDDAELTMAIANDGGTPDRLVSVTGTGFTSVRISGTGTATATGSGSAASTSAASTSAATTGAATTSAATTTGVPTPTGSAGASSSGSPSASTSGSAGAAATATGSNIAGATGTPSSASSSEGGAQTIQVPAQSIVLLGKNAPHVFLQGLTSSLTAGQSVLLKLTFANAGSVTVRAIVSGPTEEVPVTSSFDFTKAPDVATTSSAGQG